MSEAEKLVLLLRRLSAKASKAANEITFDPAHPVAKVSPVLLAAASVTEAMEVLDAVLFAEARAEAARRVAS